MGGKVSKQKKRKSQKKKDQNAFFKFINEGGLTYPKAIKLSLVRGVFFGLGTVIGGTIVLAILVWVLSLFNELPLIGEITEQVQTRLNQ